VQLTNATGLAAFNDLRIAEIGTKRLRATANEEIPAESNTFQIVAGAAAAITAIGGTPQSATVSHQFPLALQTQVKDSAGNPVSGVTVTFSAPPSGPSGTFAGTITVTTDGNGIATAPRLTANSQAGSFMVTAAATGVASPAVFALTNLPQQTSAILVNPDTLAFTTEINQAAPSGQIVQITASMNWTISSTALVFVTYTITDKPSLVITPHILVFITGSNTVTPAAQTLRATSTSRAIAYHVTAQVSTPSGGTWLQVSSTQWQTTGTVTVTANPAGLTQGVYDGAIVFTPVESRVNSVAVPVTLIVGCGQGGCVIEPNIISVVNGASFHPDYDQIR
jgi:adhesin/invasin